MQIWSLRYKVIEGDPFGLKGPACNPKAGLKMLPWRFL